MRTYLWLSLISAFFVLSSDLFAAENQPKALQCFYTPQAGSLTPFCPHQARSVLLSPDFPPAGLFIAYSPNLDLEGMLEELTATIWSKNPNFKVNLIVSSSQKNEALLELSKGSLLKPENTMRLNVIDVYGQEVLWSQDYFELFTSSAGKTLLVDLPYRTQEGEEAAESLARSCAFSKADLNISIPQFAETANGSYGGNIEPISSKTIAIGDQLNSKLLSQLNTTLAQNTLMIQSSWLEVGHIDELMMVHALPSAQLKPGICPLYLVRSSPQRALDLIAQHKNFRKLMSIPGLEYSEREYFFSRCLTSESFASEHCADLKRANIVYEKIIAKEASRMSNQIKKDYGCSTVHLLLAPQLFYPASSRMSYGQPEDGANPLNANLVNAIELEGVYFAPQQNIPELGDDLGAQLKRLGVEIKFLKSQSLHRAGGGIHCASQIVRQCKEK